MFGQWARLGSACNASPWSLGPGSCESVVLNSAQHADAPARYHWLWRASQDKAHVGNVQGSLDAVQSSSALTLMTYNYLRFVPGDLCRRGVIGNLIYPVPDYLWLCVSQYLFCLQKCQQTVQLGDLQLLAHTLLLRSNPAQHQRSPQTLT